MGVTVGWDVWAPVLRGEASQGPSVPIQSRGRDSYGPCLPCSRHLVFTRGGLWALRRGGQRARSHTPMWDSHQALPALLSGVRNWNKLTAPKQADGDAGSGCPPAKRDRLISTHSACSFWEILHLPPAPRLVMTGTRCVCDPGRGTPDRPPDLGYAALDCWGLLPALSAGRDLAAVPGRAPSR